MMSCSKFVCLGAVASLFVAAGVAHAATTALTFEGLQDQEDIANYYNGGLGSFGSGPGPSYGITFPTGAQTVIDAAGGGSGGFSNPPTEYTVMDFSLGATVDVAPGFDTGFSFYYALDTGSVGVSVYSGLDGTGTLLATQTLTPTSDPFNVWLPSGMSFAGTALSVVFTGDTGEAGFDNMTFGSATPAPPDATPEPASLSLLGLGAAALLTRRRKTVA